MPSKLVDSCVQLLGKTIVALLQMQRFICFEDSLERTQPQLDFEELDFKELDFKELGVLGYLLGVLGYLMQWRSHLLGVPMSGRSDEWKSRCEFSPSGGKVAPPTFYDEWAFPFNGRSHLMGVPINRASMSGKVCAICRPPAANCTSRILR